MTTQTSTGFGNSFSSNITVQGKQLLEQRLVHLRTVERDHIAQLFQIAASEGDLSENAGYDDAREQSFRLEKQIADLERYLDSAVLVGANLFQMEDLQESNFTEHIPGGVPRNPVSSRRWNSSV